MPGVPQVAARDVEVTCWARRSTCGWPTTAPSRGDGARRAGRDAGETRDLAALQPGDWARLGRAGAVERGTVQTDEVAPWLHGQIVARDRAMADVVDELRRYYRGMIVVADDSLRGRRVTGVYNLSDPKEALSAIVGAHGGSCGRCRPGCWSPAAADPQKRNFSGEKSDAAVVA